MAYGKYVGSYSTLDPSQGSAYGELFTGYSLGSTTIGSSTSSQAVNQIAEISQRLNEGMTQIEVSPASAYQLESMPKQHLEEIRRLASMSNAGVSLHTGYGGEDAIDPSGFTQQGWEEKSRLDAERRMMSIVETGRTMNPKEKGNAVVTFHPTSGMPGTEFIYEEKKEKEHSIGIVDIDTGKLNVIKGEKRFDEEEGKMEWYTPERILKIQNHSEWNNGLFNIAYQKKEADKVWNENQPIFLDAIKKVKDLKEQGIEKEQALAQLTPVQQNSISKFNSFVVPAYNAINMMIRNKVEEAWKSYDERIKSAKGEYKDKLIETKNKLEEDAKKWSKNITESDKSFLTMSEQISINDNFLDKLNTLGYERKVNENGETTARAVAPPEKFMKIEDFALAKASETFGNVAWKAFKSAKRDVEKAPIISIENFQPGTIFSRADKLKELVKASRNQFVEKAVDSGMKQREAEETAEKLIGATWDVGHINLLRKEGLEGKELKKKIREETEKIAPYAKHLHLTDNFGFADTHLSPGMGNVPIKAIMEEMEKAGYSGKAIVEAGNFAAQFKTAPHPYALEALGAPIYQGGGTAWQMGVQGSYFGGMGNFPEQHFSMYGAGFSGLPPSLGGAGAGGKQQSRFSGAPME